MLARALRSTWPVALGLAAVLGLAAARGPSAPVRARSVDAATAAPPGPTTAPPQDSTAPDAASPAAAGAVDDAEPVASPTPAGPRPWADGVLDWLVIGGGPTPSSTQASLEADAQAAQAALAGQGATLFAGGTGSRVVAVDTLELDELGALRRELAALLAPEHAMPTAFVPVTIEASAADAGNVEAALQSQWLAATSPLWVVVSGHGERAETRLDVRLPFWGGAAWTPRTLAQALDGAAADRQRPLRPLRFVVGACFSGAFAELAFHGANSRAGASDADRCGVFASTWDLESSGCDADPDRRHHEGYARVFWSALQRRDADGEALEPEDIDFDRDGAISLLEAHTRVRIASTSFDVPTTTSERWLRVALAHGDPDDAGVELGTAPGLAEAPSPTAAQLAAMRPLLVEEFAVIAALARTLRLDDPFAGARSAWEDRDALVEEADDALADLQSQEQTAAATLAAALLRTWPELQDAWHPDFDATLRRDAAAIAGGLRSHPSHAAWRRLRASRDAAARLADRAWVARALAERLLRAVDNVRFAVALHKRGGDAWQTYVRLRTCERSVPPIRQLAPATP